MPDAAAGRNVIQETLLNKDLSKNYYIISRAYAEIKVDPYLTLSTNVGYDIRNNRRSTYGNKIIGDAAREVQRKNLALQSKPYPEPALKL